jgi:putative transposase
MEDYKRHTSFVVNQVAGLKGRQVWQDGFRDDGLHTPQAIKAVVRYVVLNPVKVGLVKRPEDYPYLAWAAEWLE